LIACNGGRELDERFPEDAPGRIVHNMRNDRVVVAFERCARNGHAAFQPETHQCDLLANVSRPRFQSADVVLVIFDGGERHLLREAREAGVKTGIGVDRHLVIAEVEGLDRLVDLALEDVVVHLLGLR